MHKFIIASTLAFRLLGEADVNAQVRDTDVTFYNRGSERISHIHSKPLNDRYWSGDLLVGVIPPGTSRRVEVGDGAEGCRFDIRIIDGVGDVATFYRINACNSPELTIKDGDYN